MTSANEERMRDEVEKKEIKILRDLDSIAFKPNFKLKFYRNHPISTSSTHDVTSTPTYAMDFKSGNLSLSEIHKSIESTITSLRQQHKEIQESIGVPCKIKQVVGDVIKPVCDIVKQDRVVNNEALKLLLFLHKSVVSASIIGKAPPESITSPAEDFKGTSFNKRSSGSCILPPVVTPQSTGSHRPRPPLTSCIRYPTLNNSLTRSPNESRGSPRVSSPLRRNTPPPSRVSPTHDVEPDPRLSERQDELRHFVDDVEGHTCTLQATFSTFTQRILVPLQTFCKHRARSKSKQTDETESSEAPSSEAKTTNDLHRCEFIIVQTMNRIRRLLWPTVDGVPGHIFSTEGISKQISSELDCERFPVVRILPDVLQKFNDVLNSANLWLKCDKLYTENAKYGMYRAHRRYVKTERMWQEARQSHRQLLCEWDRTNAEVHTNTTRLETLEQDIEMLREDLSKSQDQRRTLEVKLRSADENMDHLRARHRALRKRISLLDRKIEARERNYEFMESRVRSLKADQEALQEKLRISDEFTNSLQGKMQQLYHNRAAWNRRYQEKTDPEVLKTKFEAARLRIPLPTVREKTFILKTRMENLREALTIVTGRLEANRIHWSTLCCHLRWPGQFLLTLPSINARDRQKDLADSDDSSSTSSASSTTAGKSRTPSVRGAIADWQSAPKIIDYVKSNCQGNERQQCAFMLNLWLCQSGQHASLEQLLHALRASRMSDVVTYVERCVR